MNKKNPLTRPLEFWIEKVRRQEILIRSNEQQYKASREPEKMKRRYNILRRFAGNSFSEAISALSRELRMSESEVIRRLEEAELGPDERRSEERMRKRMVAHDRLLKQRHLPYKTVYDSGE